MVPAKGIFVALAVILLSVGIQSYGLATTTSPDVELTCPIDGSKFKFRFMSTYSLGVHLDLQPYGRGPWEVMNHPLPLAKCPSNGFVLFKNKFSDGELDKLRRFVETSEYKKLRAKESDYFMAAKLMAHIGDKSRSIAHTLLRATWPGAQPGGRYPQYATEALHAFRVALEEQYANRRDWFTDQVVAGELERRLGKFDEARQRFLRLADLKPEMEAPENRNFRVMVDYQLQLIEIRDTQSHRVPTEKK